MMIKDLTHRSVNELSLVVFKTEEFYCLRDNLHKLIISLDWYYDFTKEQLAVLKQEIESEACND